MLRRPRTSRPPKHSSVIATSANTSSIRCDSKASFPRPQWTLPKSSKRPQARRFIRTLQGSSALSASSPPVSARSDASELRSGGDWSLPCENSVVTRSASENFKSSSVQKHKPQDAFSPTTRVSRVSTRNRVLHTKTSNLRLITTVEATAEKIIDTAGKPDSDRRSHPPRRRQP